MLSNCSRLSVGDITVCTGMQLNLKELRYMMWKVLNLVQRLKGAILQYLAAFQRTNLLLPWSLSHGIELKCSWTCAPVSQRYVYPRVMCIPVHISLVICVSPPIWLPVICVSPTPLPPKQVPVLFLSFSFYRIFESFPFDWNKQRAQDFWMHGSSCLQCIYFTVYMLYRCIKAQAFDAPFIEPRE